ncbi:hypothetical protein Rsub_02238 [Raphidocelis subcapitata]|uniref:Uncharacterized protein n=1 Tax=Raphidocelis subcapitata TaxID=307507 RepID=A0A2V0NUW3_9CHLO|nr:hypothetical protein Rsub_02238 [Raphidocelis subcapitata]|eukprot:GBF89360.1 hypothetical protein Rsub_02238 [Raphidocelis subcapitata]
MPFSAMLLSADAAPAASADRLPRDAAARKAAAYGAAGAYDRQPSIAFTIDEIISNGEDLGLLPDLLDAPALAPGQAGLTTAQAAAAFAASGGASSSASGAAAATSSSGSDAPWPAHGQQQGASTAAAQQRAALARTATAAADAAAAALLEAGWLDGALADAAEDDLCIPIDGPLDYDATPELCSANLGPAISSCASLTAAMQALKPGCVSTSGHCVAPLPLLQQGAPFGQGHYGQSYASGPCSDDMTVHGPRRSLRAVAPAAADAAMFDAGHPLLMTFGADADDDGLVSTLELPGAMRHSAARRNMQAAAAPAAQQQQQQGKLADRFQGFLSRTAALLGGGGGRGAPAGHVAASPLADSHASAPSLAAGAFVQQLPAVSSFSAPAGPLAPFHSEPLHCGTFDPSDSIAAAAAAAHRATVFRRSTDGRAGRPLVFSSERMISSARERQAQHARHDRSEASRRRAARAASSGPADGGGDGAAASVSDTLPVLRDAHVGGGRARRASFSGEKRSFNGGGRCGGGEDAPKKLHSAFLDFVAHAPSAPAAAASWWGPAAAAAADAGATVSCPLLLLPAGAAGPAAAVTSPGFASAAGFASASCTLPPILEGILAAGAAAAAPQLLQQNSSAHSAYQNVYYPSADPSCAPRADGFGGWSSAPQQLGHRWPSGDGAGLGGWGSGPVHAQQEQLLNAQALLERQLEAAFPSLS